jgi:hypothetical protein
MSREIWGYALWGALIGFGAIPELLAAFSKRVPWPTLSETAWNLEARSGWASIAFLAGLAVLTVHIVARWPRN